MESLWPQAPLDPSTTPIPPSAAELWAGPLGLLGLIPLIPLIRLAARRWPRAALLGGFLAWSTATAGPAATCVLVAWVACGQAWICILLNREREGRLARRTRLALTWIGLHLLVLPLWWVPAHAWAAWDPANRFAALHSLGFAYLLVRLIAWGVDARPNQPLRPLASTCWLLYPPCSRYGPVLLRQDFLTRLDAWLPAARPDYAFIARRIASALIGLILLGILAKNMPRAEETRSVLLTPQHYDTQTLLRAFYFIPSQIYLLLWSYSELALGLARWLGIDAPENFHKLPVATSVRDFWRRWHLSLGAWLRDYLYIPLGGARRRTELNYLIVFVYVGIWHGASWSYAAWGVSQAAGLCVNRWWDLAMERCGRPAWTRSPLWRGLCWLLTMHYQAASIVLMWDSQHCGARYFPELLRRLNPIGA